MVTSAHETTSSSETAACNTSRPEMTFVLMWTASHSTPFRSILREGPNLSFTSGPVSGLSIFISSTAEILPEFGYSIRMVGSIRSTTAALWRGMGAAAKGSCETPAASRAARICSPIPAMVRRVRAFSLGSTLEGTHSARSACCHVPVGT